MFWRSRPGGGRAKRPFWPFVGTPGHWQGQGLVAWCPLMHGPLWQDLSQHTDALAVNGPTLATMPGFGSVFKFATASDQYINLGNPTALQLSGTAPYTLSAWVHPVTVATGQQILAKDKDTGGRAYTLDLDPTNGFRFYINGGAGGIGIELFHQATAPSAGVTSHVCVTVKQTDPYVSLFVNGRLAADGAGSGSPPNTPSATANVLIGRREYTGFEQPFDGYIWDVRIYSRSLSAAEVYALYDPASRWALYSQPMRTWLDSVAAAISPPYLLVKN